MKHKKSQVDPQELLDHIEKYLENEFSRDELHHRLHELLLLLKEALKENTENTKIITKAYIKLGSGEELTDEEMEIADHALVEQLKYLGIAFLGMLPGSFFTLPGLVALARHFGIDLLPDLHIEDD